MKNLIVAEKVLPTFDFSNMDRIETFHSFRFQSILNFKIARVENTVVEEWF